MSVNPAVSQVLRSQDYYRLKQLVRSPGDIYELDASTKAIYIGPDSDIGEVLVQYFNPNAPNSVESAVVSINGPFVGRLDSMLASQVPATGQPGRILVSPVDIVDNSYRRPGDAQPLRSYNIPAYIDLIAALAPLPDIPAVRADRTLRFPSVPFDLTPDPDDPFVHSTDLIIPIYGRRMVTVTTVSVVSVVVAASLVTLFPGRDPEPRLLGEIEIPSTFPPTTYTRTIVYRASDAARQGISYLADGTQSGYYAESDQPPDPVFAGYSVPVPRGMADLLVINLRSLADTGPGTRLVDLFIKVSDHES